MLLVVVVEDPAAVVVVEQAHSVVVVVLLLDVPVVVVVLLVVDDATPHPSTSIDQDDETADQIHLQVPLQADTAPTPVVVVVLVLVVVVVKSVSSASTTQRRSGFCSAVSNTPAGVSASGLAFQKIIVTTLPSAQRCGSYAPGLVSRKTATSPECSVHVLPTAVARGIGQQATPCK